MLHNRPDLLSDPEIQDDFDDLSNNFYNFSGSCPDDICHDIFSGFWTDCSEQIHFYFNKTFYVESKSIHPWDTKN